MDKKTLTELLRLFKLAREFGTIVKMDTLLKETKNDRTNGNNA